MAKFKWVSSLAEQNYSELIELQKKLVNFYSENKNYYSAIDFTRECWISDSYPEQKDIVSIASQSKKILEIGCGSANILLNNKIEHSAYWGIDFSEDLIKMNSEKYSSAHFSTIQDPYKFDFPDQSFDLVFSHYVLEHCVFPAKFLMESLRLLKSGGTLIILCPSFLERKKMSSQKLGLSQGNTIDKLQQGKFLDVIVTIWDTRVIMPSIAKKCISLATEKPSFFVNLYPSCFTYSFQPDVDATYVTFAPEIVKYLSDYIEWNNIEEPLKNYSKAFGHIYLKGIKKSV